ncbi:MAG: transketolase family protein [Candidatus Pacebacteria bacterium]|nr:transketolase family protein [Candidatus Paceibacterota bacterium]
MLNKKLKLNLNMFDSDVEQVAIRNGFGDGLLEAANIDANVVGLCADLTESTRMHLFAQEFPERFIEVGITEQHMASCASGMAAMGKVPFISSYAMFNPGRNWEQIRTTICYNNVPVKIIGSHAGISVGPDGGTHQAIEDIAITRVIPNIEVVVPCDSLEANRATLAIAKSGKPAYLRLAREKTPIVTTTETPFEIGKAQILYESESPQVAIIAIGPMVHQSLLAAKELEDTGIGSIVINSATVKPLDSETILSVAKRVKGIVTAETHQKVGGLGSAITELLAQENPITIRRVGIDDVFGQSGTPEELMSYYKLGVADIIAEVYNSLNKKF